MVKKTLEKFVAKCFKILCARFRNFQKILKLATNEMFF